MWVFALVILQKPGIPFYTVNTRQSCTHKTRLEHESLPSTETPNAASEGTWRLYILYVTTQFNPWWWGGTHITSSKGSHCVKNWTRDPIYDFKKCGSFYRDPPLGLVSGTAAIFRRQASLWAHAHVPSLGTHQHSPLLSLWPHCMSTSGKRMGTPLLTLSERKITFLTLYTTSEVDLSFVSFLFNKQIHEATVYFALWPTLTAAARRLVIYTICQVWWCQTEDTSWVMSTLLLHGWVPTKWLCQWKQKSHIYILLVSELSMKMITMCYLAWPCWACALYLFIFISGHVPFISFTCCKYVNCVYFVKFSSHKWF